MKVTTIQYLYGTPYITRANLCKQFNMSPASADKKIKGIKEQMEKGRYGDFAYIKDGGFVMINYLVLIDYMKYREQLAEKNLCKSVPAFNPKEIAREIGWYESCVS